MKYGRSFIRITIAVLLLSFVALIFLSKGCRAKSTATSRSTKDTAFAILKYIPDTIWTDDSNELKKIRWYGRGDKIPVYRFRNKPKLEITVDFKTRSFLLRNGDSIWHSDWNWIKQKYEDTIIHLKNWMPHAVIIIDGDTIRSYRNDTLRFNYCKPSTSYNPKFAYIDGATEVIIR